MKPYPAVSPSALLGGCRVRLCRRASGQLRRDVGGYRWREIEQARFDEPADLEFFERASGEPTRSPRRAPDRARRCCSARNSAKSLSAARRVGVRLLSGSAARRGGNIGRPAHHRDPPRRADVSRGNRPTGRVCSVRPLRAAGSRARPLRNVQSVAAAGCHATCSSHRGTRPNLRWSTATSAMARRSNAWSVAPPTPDLAARVIVSTSKAACARPNGAARRHRNVLVASAEAPQASPAGRPCLLGKG